MTLLLVLTVLSVAWRVALSEECSNVNLVKCTSLVSVHGQPSAVVPWYSKAVVKDICSRYEQFVQCLDNVLPNCVASVKLLYQGLRDAYDFICNDGFDDYLQYQPCFTNSGVQTEAAFCNQTLRNKMQYLNMYNTSYRRARLCQYADDYIDCVGNVIKSFCSLAAETWQKKFQTVTLCPLLVSQGCLGWATQCQEAGSSYNTQTQQVNTPSWFIIVLSLSIALASLIIVIAVVILACFRFCPACRRRRPSQQQQQACRRPSLAIDMPPPYPGPFIPGQVSDLASPHPVPTVPNDLISGADEASGGVDVIEKWPIGDNDEGHFVPDDVEMNAKLAEAIPPPPSFNYDQRHHRHHDRHHRHRQRPVSQQQQHREDSSCFVPDDAVPDRLTAARPRRQVSMPGCTTPVSAGCRRQTSANTCGSDSSTAISFNVSGCSSPATGFTASSSSRRCSPPSFFVPSTTSSSVSSQSPLVYTDDPDTTQTDIDYY